MLLAFLLGRIPAGFHLLGFHFPGGVRPRLTVRLGSVARLPLPRWGSRRWEDQPWWAASTAFGRPWLRSTWQGRSRPRQWGSPRSVLIKPGLLGVRHGSGSPDAFCRCQAQSVQARRVKRLCGILAGARRSTLVRFSSPVGGFSRSRGCVRSGQGRSILATSTTFQARLELGSLARQGLRRRQSPLRGCVGSGQGLDQAGSRRWQVSRRCGDAALVAITSQGLDQAGSLCLPATSLRSALAAMITLALGWDLFRKSLAKLNRLQAVLTRSQSGRGATFHKWGTRTLGKLNRFEAACHGQSRPRQSPSIGPWLRLNFADCVGSGQGLSRPRYTGPP